MIVDRYLKKDAYSVVRSVYNNLDTINQAVNISKDPSVEFLQENLDTFQEANENASSLKELNNHLDELLKTPDYVSGAKSEIEDIISQAKEETDKNIEATNAKVDEINNLAEQFKTNVDIVTENKDNIDIVANNIGSVNTVAGSIDSIETVSEYIDLSTTEPAKIQDWGVIGSEGDTPSDYKSSIDIVAENIIAINSLYENLDDILKITADGGVEALIELSKKIKLYLSHIKDVSEQIDESVKGFDSKVNQFDLHYEELALSLKSIRNETLEIIQQKLNEIISVSDKVNEDKEQAAEYAKICSRKVQLIKEYYVTLTKGLEDNYRKYIQKLSEYGDTKVHEVTTSIEDQIQRIEAAAKSIVDRATSAISNHAQITLEDFKSSLNRLTQAKLQELLTQLSDYELTLETKLTNKYQELFNSFTEEFNRCLKQINDETVESLERIKAAEDSALSKINIAGKDFLDKLDEGLLGVYRFKGTVNTFSDLLKLSDTAKNGDTYRVKNENNAEYSWTGTEWDALGANSLKDFGVIGN